jgi:hypothetical protein
MRSFARLFVGVVGLVFLSSCDALTGNKDKSISLTFPKTSLTVGQGARDSVEITINRSNFDQPVTFSVEGTLPQGVTATFSPNPVQPGNTTTKLRVTASAQAVPGNATFTVVAKGEGIADKGQEVAVSITLTGTYTLSLIHPSVTVAQNGAGETVALLTRTEGNASNVSLSVTGAPAGLTVAIESPASGRGSGVSVSASGSVAAGTYPVTITGQAAGITPDQSVQLSVVVIAPPAATTISLPFCTVPNWFAFRNEGGTWQRVQPSGNSFTFAASQKVAIAYAQEFGTGVRTNVLFFSRDGLLGQSDRDCDGPRNLTGTVTGMTAGQSALIALGANGQVTTTSSYNIQAVASRLLDLVATRGTLASGNLVPDKLIIRRSQDYTSTIPDLDFTGAESFAPTSSALNVSGFGNGFIIDFTNYLWSATSTYGPINAGPVPGGSTTLYSVPAAQLVAADRHELAIDAYSTDGRTGHGLYAYFGGTGDRTETLGPLLSIPQISVPTTTPYTRLRAQLPSQPEYPGTVVFFAVQGTSPNIREVLMIGSASYFGGMPATWDFLYPDLANVSGFNTSWAPAAGQALAFYGQAFDARDELLLGAVPNLGETIRVAYRLSQTSTLLRASGPSTVLRRPLLVPRQYFRR